MKSWWIVAAFLPACLGATADVSVVLRQQTQDLVDAIGSGSSTLWERYLDPQAAFTTEDGELLTKAQLVDQTKPFPEGVSGSIHVIDFHVTQAGRVAVAFY